MRTKLRLGYCFLFFVIGCLGASYKYLYALDCIDLDSIAQNRLVEIWKKQSETDLFKDQEPAVQQILNDPSLAPKLVHRLLNSHREMNLNEKKAALLMLTQNIALSREYQEATKLESLLDKLSLNTFVEYFLQNDRKYRNTNEYISKSFVPLINELALKRKYFWEYYQRVNRDTEILAMLQESPWSEDVRDTLANIQNNLNKQYSKNFGSLARLHFRVMQAKVKSMRKAIDSNYERYLSETESISQKTKDLFFKDVIPEATQQSKAFMKAIIMIVLTHWSFYYSYTLIDDPSIPPSSLWALRERKDLYQWIQKMPEDEASALSDVIDIRLEIENMDPVNEANKIKVLRFKLEKIAEKFPDVDWGLVP